MKKTALWFDSQFQQYKRVWRLLKKPSMEEFKTITKVTALGLLIIGAFGFIIGLIMKFGFGSVF